MFAKLQLFFSYCIPLPTKEHNSLLKEGIWTYVFVFVVEGELLLLDLLQLVAEVELSRLLLELGELVLVL